MLSPAQATSSLNSFALPASLAIPKFIAEIGCNHRGDIETEKQMIVVAKTCGADIVKFQKRHSRELLTPEQYDAPYDNINSYGKTYGEHREFLEFDLKTHAKLKEYAEEHGVEYSASVWDLTSARELTSLHPGLLKVPSACNNHVALLQVLRDEFEGEVHISVGMSTEEEIEAAVDVFRSCPQRVVLYSCISGYPVAFDDVCLLEIVRLIEKYKNTGRVGAIGFSGHHNGIAIDSIAAVLGASFIERHFTLDRAWKGSDHSASLEPSGFSRLTRDIKHLGQAWTFKPTEFLPVELPQREKLKFRHA